MVRIAAVLAVVVGATVWALGGEVERAGACTGFGPEYSFSFSPVVFEGWVREVELIPGSGMGSRNHIVRFEVVRGHRGSSEGGTVESRTYLRLPGDVPTPCPSFTPEDLRGKYVIAALTDLFDGSWGFLTIYVADGPGMSSPDGLSYADAVRLTELATDSNPELPLLRVTPGEARCGETVTFNGERFAPGNYVLAVGYGGTGLARVQADPAGRFEARVTLGPCQQPHPEAWPWVVEALPHTPSTHFISLGPAVEYAVLTITGTVALPTGEPAVEVAPGARCGGSVTVIGTGLEPNTTYPVDGISPESKVATTDGQGRFTTTIPIPGAFCEPGGLQAIRILQPGFEDYGSRFTVAQALFEVGAPPGPPTVGNSPPPSPAPLLWLQLAGLAMLVLGASGLAARR